MSSGGVSQRIRDQAAYHFNWKYATLISDRYYRWLVQNVIYDVNVIYEKYSQLCQNLFTIFSSIEYFFGIYVHYNLLNCFRDTWGDEIFSQNLFFFEPELVHCPTGGLQMEESLIEQLVYHLVIPCRCRSSTTGGRAMAPTGQSINQSVSWFIQESLQVCYLTMFGFITEGQKYSLNSAFIRYFRMSSQHSIFLPSLSLFQACVLTQSA